MMFLFLLLTFSFGATDLSGQWSITMKPDFRGNHHVAECHLHHRGSELTVKCGEGQEMHGKVQGRKLVWRTAPTKDGVIATFNADLDDAGGEFEGEWTLRGGVLNERGRFAGRRSRR
jgi:hypothetical protein